MQPPEVWSTNPFVLRYLLLAVATVTLSGASCGKKSSAREGEDDAKELAAALDRATQEQEAKGPRPPVDGVDLKNLDDGQKARFDKLIDSLVSPCGKAESLRKSATVTRNCKRSLHAARYVATMIEMGAEDSDVRKFYGARYVDRENNQFKVGPDVPHAGPTDAPVVLVEFYDYGCKVCLDTYPMIEALLAAHPQDLVVYYKQNPIVDKHPDSGNAAQAAVAAHKQGKFKEMHEALFKGFGSHSRGDVFGYARELGLDMARFEKDFEAAAAQVKADDAEGNTVKVMGTPTLFINGQRYEDPLEDEFFESWVQEELAVNR